MAAFAPMARARVRTETSVKRGDLRSLRRSCREDERRKAMAMTH
jgi:hypothetical protein